MTKITSDTNGNLVVDVNQIIRDASVHANVEQVYLVLTEDKVRLCLRDHASNLEQRNSWQAPLGVFLSVVFTLVTTDPKDAFFLSAAVWKAIFVITAGLSGFWLMKSAVAAHRVASVHDVVVILKAGAASTTTSAVANPGVQQKSIGPANSST